MSGHRPQAPTFREQARNGGGKRDGKTIRLTAAQAVVRYLAAQRSDIDGAEVPLFAGCWAIFGHGNVAGTRRGAVPRPRNPAHLPRPQRAGHGAGGRRLRQGQEPPADDGLHHLDRAGRRQHGHRRRRGSRQPAAGPVPARRRLRQPRAPIRCCSRSRTSTTPPSASTTVSAPFRRWWDRITRPEQLLTSLPRAIQVLTDPVDCGPVTLACAQDVQAEAFDYPESFFAPADRTASDGPPPMPTSSPAPSTCSPRRSVR